MFTRSTTRAGLLAGAVNLALAAPAGAAVVEWQAGPLDVAAGQAVQVGVFSPTYSCQAGVKFLPLSTALTQCITSAGQIATCVYDILPGGTVSPPTHGVGVPARYYILSNGPYAVLNNIVGRELAMVTTRVRVDCRGISTANIRNSVTVTVGVYDRDTAEARTVVQAVPTP